MMSIEEMKKIEILSQTRYGRQRNKIGKTKKIVLP